MADIQNNKCVDLSKVGRRWQQLSFWLKLVDTGQFNRLAQKKRIQTHIPEITIFKLLNL